MAARKASPAKKATRTTRKATKRTTGRSQAKRATPVKRAAKRPYTPAAAKPARTSPLRTYVARQAVVGPNGRVRKGELVQLSPDSGLAKSPFVSLVEDAAPPAGVAAALDDAG